MRGMSDQEYITAEEHDEEQARIELEAVPTDIPVADWETQLVELSEGKSKKLSIPRNKEFNRKQVVNAFQNAFELIGGTPRLALWAHKNEKEFYKLYSRLLPSQSSSALGETNEMIVRHVLPKGPLDS